MKLSQLLQICGSLVFFLIFLLINWYQGSGITDDPFEWEYTAKFTQFFLGTIPIDYHDINQLDFFVYSAKFYPITFIIMMFSFVYFITITFISIKKYYKTKITMS